MNQRPQQEQGKPSLMCLSAQESMMEASHTGGAEHGW